LISYMRRELMRLEGLSDEVVLGAMKIGTERQGIEKIRFGPGKGSGM
jgi:cytochrome b pre-mRNA-processing protein 3